MGKRGGGVSRFSVESFFPTKPKVSLVESFTAALIWGIEKVWIGGGEVSRFRSKNFRLTVPKSFVVQPFCAVFRKFSAVEMFMDKRGDE